MKRFSILKQPIFSTINDHLIDYPSPSNLNYFWNFGSSAGLCLIIQIATGIFFAYLGEGSIFSLLFYILFFILCSYKIFNRQLPINKAAGSLLFALARQIAYYHIEALTAPFLNSLQMPDDVGFLLYLRYLRYRVVCPRAPQIDNPFERVSAEGWQENQQEGAETPEMGDHN